MRYKHKLQTRCTAKERLLNNVEGFLFLDFASLHFHMFTILHGIYYVYACVINICIVGVVIHDDVFWKLVIFYLCNKEIMHRIN